MLEPCCWRFDKLSLRQPSKRVTSSTCCQTTFHFTRFSSQSMAGLILLCKENRTKMPPRDLDHSSTCFADSLQERAAMELEGMRDGKHSSRISSLHPLPPACFRLLKSLSGNGRCMDCGARHPEWAAVSYGALVCLQCSGRHRGLGVQVRRNHVSMRFRLYCNCLLTFVFFCCCLLC